LTDRQTVYMGQLAREVDVLLSGQNAMVGLAKLSEEVLGLSTIVDGFAVTPTTPASLNVILTAGQINQLENLEATSWSSVAADTAHSILKQGIALDPQTFGIAPPGTVGFSQVFLVEVQYQDVDAGSTVLPYFNASNPASPFNGPANAGTAQNTVRKGAVAAQIKAGIAAATGTQVAPTADAGWTAIFTITVANGAATITSGNISQVASAPFLPAKLPNIPKGVQNQTWLYAHDTGTANNLVATIFPTPSALVEGMCVEIKLANAITGPTVFNLNGLGNTAVKRYDGSALQIGDGIVGEILRMRFDGTVWQCGFRVATPGGGAGFTANTNFFVNASTGSDANNGLTSGTAWQTIQHAVNFVAGINLNGFSITINVATGTYAAFTLPAPTGVGVVTILGDVVTPSNCLVASASGPAIKNNTQGVTGYVIMGLKLTSSAASGGQPGAGIWVTTRSSVQITKCDFGPCATSHIQADQGGLIQILGTDAPGANGYINISGNAGQAHLAAFGNSVIAVDAVILNINTACSVSQGFAEAFDLGLIKALYGTINNPGNITGPRYFATSNSVIETNGGGASFLPGSSAGSVSNGGFYG
jgi:hypothetical protein